MTFGQKLRKVRLSLNISQSELAKKTGISERSLYAYEQLGTLPRSGNLQKIADALNVSVSYLLDDEEYSNTRYMNQDIYLANIKNEYGGKGARVASDILSRTSELFSGAELDEEAKELFFKTLTEVYLDSKNGTIKSNLQKQRARKPKSK